MSIIIPGSGRSLAVSPNNRLLSPLRGWDGLSAASRLQVRPKAERYTAISIEYTSNFKEKSYLQFYFPIGRFNTWLMGRFWIAYRDQ
ncbi:hypothetical protein [Billgrantia endophytica]|uniref:Uncharacterized protein n=1 Tax=Billgrantia endophytica TaxID=2033802 RepID=A0A2N7TZG9_9GAMM|nr:hypothetical protein [Halomonas endophytica]PMR73571.1 hypothetical protein C1H69_16735 [Halomonas endophytica]